MISALRKLSQMWELYSTQR